MKKSAIIFVPAFLIVLSSFTLWAFAREEEHEDEREHSAVTITATTNAREDHRFEEKKKTQEKLKKLREKQKERLKKIRERLEEAHHRSGTGVTQTGSTQSGIVRPVTPKPTSPQPKPTTPPVTSSSITRWATVNYGTPEGSVPVWFSVTVKDGIITAASSTTKVGGTSGYYQDAFAQKISSAVVGKKASGLSLSAVWGASLTTRAFTQYVASNF